MGLRRVMYILLVLNESFERSKGLRRWSLELRALRLFFKCGPHVRRLSRIKPKFVWKMALPIKVAGHSKDRSVKVI